ncbi:unnamed protein product [Cladocopium goreaui]|uniref:Uncharacterized protein n=1 Tax=Cladocopium goreaui TaxID=2562237 RepID=A0A9P1DE10_9DINO|nr:unnamed protein product [Cladocopium goreaui]
MIINIHLHHRLPSIQAKRSLQSFFVLVLVKERLLRTAEQHDVSLLSAAFLKKRSSQLWLVRNELVRVAGAAQDMAPEAEEAWLETVGT